VTFVPKSLKLNRLLATLRYTENPKNECGEVSNFNFLNCNLWIFCRMQGYNGLIRKYDFYFRFLFEKEKKEKRIPCNLKSVKLVNVNYEWFKEILWRRLLLCQQENFERNLPWFQGFIMSSKMSL
jgi:hypothetical protein